MKDFFNAYEIFEMAEQIERNGAAFYRKAAAATADKETGKMFVALAAMEDDHVKAFSSMRESLSGQEWAQGFEGENDAVLFLRAMATGKVFDDKSDLLTAIEKMDAKDILRTAVSLEKESIMFYTGMKHAVPAEFGREKIDNIIKEEMRHATMLASRLNSIK